jgi:ribose transport system ATP-binding protein
MAPFIGILGIASLGQHIVIQQRGFDLSVAGAISLAAVVVTVFTPQGAGVWITAIIAVAALAAGMLGGLVNGLLINFIRVPPLVMTIGLNALLMGFVYVFTKATVHAASAPLIAAANLRVQGISVLLIVFLVFAAFAAWFVDRTRIGRRYIMTAISPEAAHALGIHVKLYNVVTYCLAGLLFAIAGAMIAGLSVTPSLLSGNPYMLTTVAAVIVGGSPLNGDRGSIVATVIGAVFIVFLNQLVVSLGFEYAVQSMVQAAIILAGVTVPGLLRNLVSGANPKKSVVATTKRITAPAIHQADANAVLELTGIRKVFGNTVALTGVSFSALPGEVHAIIGENGAGKSTLISIAAGVLTATDGKVKIGGQLMDSGDPSVFRDAGISVAFQHPPLPSHLTVRECLALASEDFGRPGGNVRAQFLIERVAMSSLRVQPEDRISDLSIGQRHVVEIARAMASNPRILILDEPTEPFKEDDVEHLFALIRDLRKQGIAIIYISHRLNEVEEIADRISVLRDGELIATRPRADFTRADIINMIVGRPLGQVFPNKANNTANAPVCFAVRGLSGHNFHEINFEARRGEIIGIAGVEGQGQRELMRALAGLEPHTGIVELNGKPVSIVDRSSGRRHGISFVPDDRHQEGLFLSMAVNENLSVGYRATSGQPFIIDRKQENKVVAEAISELKIKTASGEAVISSLSGGNQQKVLIGREIAGAPSVLLTDEPTKGVDIGSKSDIYYKLRDLANTGVTVIVASSDGVELEGLCDRVLVMARGTVVQELAGEHVSDSEITAANLTAGELTAKRVSGGGSNTKLKSLLNSKWLPSIALLIASLVIVYFASSANIRFLSNYNLGNIQVQLATLALIAFGQLFVMLLGEIDFSVGPLAGLVVVLASFWIPDEAPAMTVLLVSIGIILLAAGIGLLQGLAVVILELPSIVVTLTGFFAVQGASLLLRPVPSGTISSTLIDTLLFAIGPLSVITVAVVLAGIAFEYILFHRPFGRFLRAIGSEPTAAAKLGVNRNKFTPAAFAINGAIVGFAGLILAATVGVGTGTAGVNYTLMSVTAVVLGGAVISGGFGSFISTFFGAVLVQMTFSSTAFLQAGVEWQYWLVGLSTLFAAGLFGFVRSNRPVH